MRKLIICLDVALTARLAPAQSLTWQPDITRQQTYVPHRASSSDPTGANNDARVIAPGATFALLDTDGPGVVSHIWLVVASDEPEYLKRVVLRMYWDHESAPSVET